MLRNGRRPAQIGGALKLPWATPPTKKCNWKHLRQRIAPANPEIDHQPGLLNRCDSRWRSLFSFSPEAGPASRYNQGRFGYYFVGKVTNRKRIENPLILSSLFYISNMLIASNLHPLFAWLRMARACPLYHLFPMGKFPSVCQVLVFQPLNVLTLTDKSEEIELCDCRSGSSGRCNIVPSAGCQSAYVLTTRIWTACFVFANSAPPILLIGDNLGSVTNFYAVPIGNTSTLRIYSVAQLSNAMAVPPSTTWNFGLHR